MASFSPTLSRTTTIGAGTWVSPYQRLDRIGTVAGVVKGDNALDVDIEWSTDAASVILTDSFTTVSGVASEYSHVVKAEFVRISVANNSGTNTSLTVQGFFFEDNVETISLISAGGTYSLVFDGSGPILSNVGLSAGTGVSITDSGTSLTINSSVLTTDSTEDLQVTYPSATSTLITVGNKQGGTDYSQSMYIDQTDPRVGDSAITNSVFLGNRAGAGDGGTSTRYSDSVCVGSKSVVGGGESVCIGARMSANSGSSNSVTIGTFATASSSGVNIGRSAGPYDGSTIRNVCIGTQSVADSYGVSIGYDAGADGTPRNYAVCIGHGCDQPGANGRLSFGSNMEGVQAGATAGFDTLPANPAGFIRLEWNGTLYKIPVYDD